MPKKAIPSGEETIRQVREEYGPKTLLSLSMGKDSIAAYLAIRDAFEEITAYHLFLVPGLEFVEESLGYYRKKLGIRIISLPHPSLYRMLNGYVLQTPANAAVIQAARLPNFTYLDIHNWVAEEVGLKGSEVLTATGVRAADSPQRRVALETHGPINRSKRLYMPVWDWNKARLVDALRKSGIALPKDYLWWGRSFDGLDLRFLVPLKRHAPKDYRRVLEFFPLAEAAIFRAEKLGNVVT